MIEGQQLWQAQRQCQLAVEREQLRTVQGILLRAFPVAEDQQLARFAAQIATEPAHCGGGRLNGGEDRIEFWAAHDEGANTEMLTS